MLETRDRRNLVPKLSDGPQGHRVWGRSKVYPSHCLNSPESVFLVVTFPVSEKPNVWLRLGQRLNRLPQNRELCQRPAHPGSGTQRPIGSRRQRIVVKPGKPCYWDWEPGGLCARHGLPQVLLSGQQ